eukprot:scaffold4031_cov135-Cylindrotheca_fusiformis.AAC.4
MVRSRRPVRHQETNGGGVDPDDNDDEHGSSKKPKTVNPRQCYRRLPIFLLCFTIYFFIGLSFRLHDNLSLGDPKQQQQQPQQPKLLLRSGGGGKEPTNATITTTTTARDSSCPVQLPSRLQNISLVPTTRKLSKQEMEYQMQNYMDANEFGTTGNKIFTCRQHKVPFCTGVVKIYRSKAMYYQVKRCLTLLQHAGITSQILYTDDEKGIMVEEDMGELTMMNSPVPLDYVVQLQWIHCVLVQHSIIHRDYNFRNFLVNQTTGKIMVIDFGDAVVWQGGLWNIENYNLRNLENMFSLWWKRHSSQAQLDIMVEVAEPMLFGNRIWRQPIGFRSSRNRKNQQQSAT